MVEVENLKRKTMAQMENVAPKVNYQRQDGFAVPEALLPAKHANE